MSEKNTHHAEPIAIIGMACIFPQAPDVQTFWRNIIAGNDTIGEPGPAWEADRYLKSRRIDTPYGGYLKELFRFDPKEFGIMPNSIDGGEPDQFIALRVAREALHDAGYAGGDYDHRETGIVLGHSTYLHRGQGNLIQHNIIVDQTIALLQAIQPSLNEDTLSRMRFYLESKLPKFNTDIVPALVPNVMTGRIANRLNFKGPNYLIDAACASSLLAVGAAIDELRNGRSRMMLAGGVNASLPAEVSVIFTQLGALSKRGKVRPFAADSDGTLLGEGLGIVVLKRLSDAVADGDRMYAVVRGTGQASDGRGLGLLVPSVEGEALAIERAYSASGVDPSTIELVEAHGTGIPLGDKTEIAALRKIFGERRGSQGHIALGSVKSIIGHCIPAAGIAGLIKSALALHHKVLPPTLCENISPELGIEATPLYVNTAARPWISPAQKPRRAGVNAFGFGGINAHAILEEAPPQAPRHPGFSRWPAELCVFSAENDDALAGRLGQAAGLPDRSGGANMGDIAASLAAQDARAAHRLAMVVTDADDFRKKINQALRCLKNSAQVRWSTRNGICYSRAPVEGAVAFMFPGEGSQYLNMLADMAMYFPEVRTWFDFWRGLYDHVPGEGRTEIIFPPPGELTEQHRMELEQRLHDMDVGSEAVFVASQALHALLASLAVRPDVMVGHSTGESSALAASGAIGADDLLRLADFIRELNRVYHRVLNEGKIPVGGLLTVGAVSRSMVEEQIACFNGDIVLAMDNCPNQLVLYGNKDSIEAVQGPLIRSGAVCVPLPFDRGYHTPQFAAVSEAFLDYYSTIGLKPPRVPLYSCTTADLYPGEEHEVKQLAARQWSSRVRFRETVLKMYRDGVRYFIEVGPAGTLSAFVNDILAGQEHFSLATDQRRRNGVEQFLTVLSQLYVNGKGVQPEKLFCSRSMVPVRPEGNGHPQQKGILLDNTMPVIRVSDADRAVIKEMLVGTDEAGGKAEETCREADPQARLPGTQDNGMAEYLDLMKDFLDRQQAMLEQMVRGEGAVQGKVSPADECTPFLSTVTELSEHHVEAECHLSVSEDNFLRDHIISGPVSEDDPDLRGLSCVPLMVSLEIMAEACALVADSTAISTIENIKAFGWLALDDGELTLSVRAELIGTSSPRYRASLWNEDVLVVSADFSFEADWRAPALDDLAEKRASRWSDDELYTIGMFHGPIFQSIRHIDGWNDQGIDACLSEVSLDGFFEKHDTPRLVLNPVLLDALGQLAAYWIAHKTGTDFNCFPSTIERIELYSQCPQNIQGLTLRARQQPLDPARSDMEAPRVWQFECLDDAGSLLLRATNFNNIYFPVPHRFYEFRRDPLQGWLGQRAITTANPDVLLWQLTHFSETFCNQSSGIFLRIAAHALLSSDERREWSELGTGARQRRRWLQGRACVKEAVRFWIFHQTGKLLYPADIIVLHDEKGAPYVDGVWATSLIQPPEVSLSHQRDLSLVAVTPPQHPVGVDVEHRERIMDADLIRGALSPHEQVLLQGFSGEALRERVLRMWCAKEAAAKYGGWGLQGRPDTFEVSFLDDRWEMARVRYDGLVVKVGVRCEQDLIIALAASHLAVTDKE